MSTTTAHFNQRLDLYDGPKPTARRWNTLAQVRLVWAALGEGLAAAKRYQELTAGGMSHEQAASKVFFEHYQTK